MGALFESLDNVCGLTDELYTYKKKISDIEYYIKEGYYYSIDELRENILEIIEEDVILRKII